MVADHRSRNATGMADEKGLGCDRDKEVQTAGEYNRQYIQYCRRQKKTHISVQEL
jgi:hypothetical protein